MEMDEQQRQPSIGGKMLFLGVGMAAGAAASLYVYRKPLETASFALTTKLQALGIKILKRVSNGGTVLRYLCGGDWARIGIVLLHEPFSNALTWHRILPRLSETFRVLAPDLPGFGGSSEPVEPRIDSYAETVHQLILDEGLQGAVLVASSLSGLIAVQAALSYPEVIRAIVLVDTPGIAAELTGDRFFIPTERCDIDELIEMTWTTPPFLPAFVRDELVVRAQRPALRGLLDDARRQREDIFAALDQLDLPAMLIWGGADHLAPVEEGGRLAAAINGSRFVRISHCGHYPHREAHEVFFQELHRFLAGPQKQIE